MKCVSIVSMLAQSDKRSQISRTVSLLVSLVVLSQRLSQSSFECFSVGDTVEPARVAMPVKGHQTDACFIPSYFDRFV